MTSLLTVRTPNKSARWYVNGKRVSQVAYDEARTGKTLDSFQTTKSKQGVVRHYVEAR